MLVHSGILESNGKINQNTKSQKAEKTRLFGKIKNSWWTKGLGQKKS
jgi:hypothetical protein